MTVLFQAVTDSRGAAPLLTECISKMVKIVHKNAAFLLTIPYSSAPPFPKFWIHRWFQVVCFLWFL